MAGSSGTAGLSDTRGDKNVVAQIAQLSWNKVKSAEKMAGAEKEYAKKKLKVGEEGGLSKEEFRSRFGRGSFFRKALGSEFGGDKVARNRGRVESFFDKDVPAGRDATKSKRSRYRSQFDYGDVEAKDPIVGSKPKTDRTKAEGERKTTRSSRMAVSEAMASALAGIEIQLTKLSERFTSTVSVPEGLIEVVNKQSKVITDGFDGLSSALYSLLGSIQKQTATMVRLDQEQKILDQKNLDRQQALDEESLLEGQNGGAGNAAVTGFGKIGGRGAGGGGILGKMFGATALAKKIGRRGAARAGVRAAAAFGGKGAAKFMAKKTAGLAAKTGLKSGLKKIPLLGLGVASFFAAQRAMKGDILGAGLELASGAASMIPGAGTAASLGVDGILAARDAGAVPFAKGGMITKPMLGIVGEGKDPELITPWNKRTFEMMNKARLDAIQRNKNKFADVQAKGLEEYYENRGGWQKFGEILVSLLKGAGLNPDNNPPGPDPDITDFKNNAPVADVAKDLDFIQEVHKLAAETGTKPSELMGMYNAEATGINTKAKNASGATGIFQLMFNPDDPNDKRYGYTREQFANLSRGDQVRAHRRYLKEAGFFDKGGSGIADVKVANIAPAFLGKGLDEPIYLKGSEAYERNKNVDIVFGNNDGVISARDYIEFVKQRGNEEAFRQFNDPETAKPPEAEPPTKISDIPEENQLGQAITKNFGMETNDTRYFNVPGYGRIEAYKTTKGFDFFKDGTKLSMHPSRPQAKAIYEYFIKTNGGQTMNGTEQSSRLLPESERYSTNRATGGGLQAIVVNGNNKQPTAAVPQGETANIGLSSDDFVPLGLRVFSGIVG